MSDRLARLRYLRAQVDAEIAMEEARLRRTTPRRPAEDGMPDCEHCRNVPGHEIRTWARNAGIPIGERGRVQATARAAYHHGHHKKDQQ